MQFLNDKLKQYLKSHPIPLWVEYHIDKIVSEMDTDEFWIEYGLKKVAPSEKNWYVQELENVRQKRKEFAEKESQKLDRLYELLTTTDKTYREAEKEVYDIDPDFYPKPKVIKPRKPRKTQEPKETLETKPKIIQTDNLYLEKGLTAEKKDSLLANSYKRLKISPFGKSGAAYYWLKPRYNESKEHAFFCYLIENELKSIGIEPVTSINNGPDLVFEFQGKPYCFDVETGTNFEKHPGFVTSKFARYRKEYEKVYIFVTKKELKYRYSKHGVVISRSMLKETMTKFSARDK